MSQSIISARSAPLPAARQKPATLGAEVAPFDVTRLAIAEVPGLLAMLARHGVLVFPCQKLSADDLLDLGRALGPLEQPVLQEFAKPGYPDVFVLSNLVEDGRPLGSVADGFGWHTDLGYLETPTAITCLYGIEVPREGGDTLFCSTEAAWAALPKEEQAGLRSLRTQQSWLHMYTSRYLRPGFTGTVPEVSEAQRARLPDVTHPLVRRHPITGAESLYLGGNSLAGFDGLDDAAAEALKGRLFAHCTQDRFVYRHSWQPGDLLLWDNRGTMHTATAYDKERDRRLVWRVSVRGERPVGD